MDSEDTRIAAEKERELYQAKAERDALRDANASLHAQVNDWHRRAVETREERDALAAKLAEIERAEPVAWMRADYSGTASPTLQFDPPGEPTVRDELLAPVWAPLYARQVPTIPNGCRAEESPPASPCRCGPDGCSDSVACPRDGGAA